jgi:hypothetical protein
MNKFKFVDHRWLWQNQQWAPELADFFSVSDWHCMLNHKPDRRFQNHIRFLYDRSAGGHYQDPMVDWNSRTTPDLDQVGQARVQDLENLMLSSDQPAVIHWSGGIDSTYILCCILQWMDSRLRTERVKVSFNHFSLMENPWFYHQILLREFALTNSDVAGLHVTGSGGDKLFVQELYLEFMHEHSLSGILDWEKYCPLLLTWLQNYLLAGAENVLVEKVLSSAGQANVEIRTLGDFFWWWGFNFYYAGQTAGVWLDPTHQIWSWFDSQLYHTYSLTTQGGLGPEDLVSAHHKSALKDLIYQTDGNHFYRQFKAKAKSGPHYQKHPESQLLRQLKQLEIIAVDHNNQRYTAQDLKNLLENQQLSST